MGIGGPIRNVKANMKALSLKHYLCILLYITIVAITPKGAAGF